MRLFIWIILVSFLQLIIGCSTNTETFHLNKIEGKWLISDLNSPNIIVLKKENDHLYAGTRDGIFVNGLHNLEENWDFLGLNTDTSAVVGLAILNADEILAAVRYDQFDPDNDMLFRTTDGGQSWIADNSTKIDGVDRFGLTYIKSHPDNFNGIFAIRGSLLFSTDFGNDWEIMFSEGSSSVFLTLSNKHPEQIWIGGDTATNSPYLAKSTDGGNNWELLNNKIGFATDAVVRDVILHHQNSDWVLAGLGGSVAPSNVIRKTTDGGENWETVLEQTGVHTFARSLQNPSLIYASGRDASTKLFFAWTSDFGETWEKKIFEEGPDVVTTSDMEVMMIEGKEVIFFGTDKGLFRFVVD